MVSAGIVKFNLICAVSQKYFPRFCNCVTQSCRGVAVAGTYYKIITVFFKQPFNRQSLLTVGGEIKSYDNKKLVLHVEREKSNQVAAQLLADFPIADLNIEEPDIQDVIRSVFAENSR